MIEDLLRSFGLVFLAELGDKSMLLAIAFATRYRPWPVIGGIAIAAFVMLGLSTLVGAGLGAALPERALAIGGGLLFLGFGIWTLLDDDEDEEEAALRGSSVLLGVTAAFLIAEFGDKTMLATVTLAGTQAPLPTWLGASLGMTLASGLAVGLAVLAGGKLPERVLRLVAAGAFLVFGGLLLWEGVQGG
ncbi:MAG: TMEM165/GDT1 family protein [Nitriliruptoraceae bacterium]|nr:TMEM165/GDT1 family protein [Nitriliruptoraceae bacterium]